MKAPAARRKTLILSAGIFWIFGAGILLIKGNHFLTESGQSGQVILLLSAAGISLGSFKFFMVLSKVVTKNVDRVKALAPAKEKVCIFAFQSIQSYLLVIGMISFGHILRLLPIDRAILGGVYIAIGSALALGALRYLRLVRTV